MFDGSRQKRGLVDSARGREPKGRSAPVPRRFPWLHVLLVLLLLGAGASSCFGQNAEDVRRQLESLVDDGHYAEALELGRRSLDRVAGSPDLAVVVARMGLEAGDVGLAGRALRAAFSRPVSDSDLLLLAADFEVRLGEIPAAQDLLERVCRRDPASGEARYRLAKVLFTRGWDAEALDRAAEAVSLSPASAEFRQLYASILTNAGRAGEALDQLENAWRLTPKDGRLLLQLADQERLAGRLSRAVEYLDLAVRSDPENPLFYRELARVERALGRHDDARMNLAEAESLDRSFAALSRSLSFAEKGELNEAVALLEPEYAGNRDFVTGGLTLADLLQRSGRDDDALEIYETILEQHPDCRQAREAAARVLLRCDRQAEAIEILHAEEGRPTAVEELLRARKEEGEGDLLQALDSLRRVEKRYPLDPTVKREVSRILNDLGRPREALASLERAYRLSPDDPRIEQDARRIRLEYAVGLENKLDWSAAQRIVETLVREQRDSLYLFHLAYCLQNQGQLASATELYREGLRQDPASEWANVNLAYCLYSSGSYAEAAAVWERLLGTARRPPYLYGLGLSRLYESRIPEGRRLIAEAAAGGYVPALDWLRRAGRR